MIGEREREREVASGKLRGSCNASGFECHPPAPRRLVLSRGEVSALPVVGSGVEEESWREIIDGDDDSIGSFGCFLLKNRANGRLSRAQQR